jgi:hypothetical protein
MKIAEIKSYFASTSIAVAVGVMSFSGAGSAENPDLEPSASQGVHPTFTGLDLEGPLEIWGSLQNSTVAENNGAVVVDDVLEVRGPIEVDGSIYNYDEGATAEPVIVNDSMEIWGNVVFNQDNVTNREISLPGATNEGYFNQLISGGELRVIGGNDAGSNGLLSLMSGTNDDEKPVVVNDTLGVFGDLGVYGYVSAENGYFENYLGGSHFFEAGNILISDNAAYDISNTLQGGEVTFGSPIGVKDKIGVYKYSDAAKFELGNSADTYNEIYSYQDLKLTTGSTGQTKHKVIVDDNLKISGSLGVNDLAAVGDLDVRGAILYADTALDIERSVRVDGGIEAQTSITAGSQMTASRFGTITTYASTAISVKPGASVEDSMACNKSEYLLSCGYDSGVYDLKRLGYMPALDFNVTSLYPDHKTNTCTVKGINGEKDINVSLVVYAVCQNPTR